MLLGSAHPVHSPSLRHRRTHRRTPPNSRYATQKATHDTGVERGATAPLGGRRLAKQISQAGNSKTTWFGWDGDRLTRVEDAQRTRETIYEPASFVPMVMLERKKGSPSATEALLSTVEADEPTRAALALMPKEARQSLEATLQQIVSEGLPAQAQAMLPNDFDTSSSAQALAQTREMLQRETLPTSIRYYHCDHLGTPIALTDEAGKVVWQAKFDPWGNLIEEHAEEGVVQPIRFQGQLFDAESGLHYNRHRYYDPALGSYITQDPIGLSGGINTSAYVADPNGWIDPLGLANGPAVGWMHAPSPSHASVWKNDTPSDSEKVKCLVNKYLTENNDDPAAARDAIDRARGERTAQTPGYDLSLRDAGHYLEAYTHPSEALVIPGQSHERQAKPRS